ncbi:MAK10-like protein [Tanacetum coccineum]
MCGEALGWLVEEIHVTLAHSEKKQTRLQLYTKSDEENAYSGWRRFQIFYNHVNPATRRTIDQAAGGKLRDNNAKEYYVLLEDLVLYENESWNDLRDFAKLIKANSLPQDVPSTSGRRLIQLENQVQCLMEAHLAPKPSVQVNKITSSCEICSGPHDTQYCMENPEQAFVDYASLCTDKAGGLVSSFMASQATRLSKFEADFKQQQQGEMTNKIDTVLKAINDQMTGALPSDIVKNPKPNVNPTSPVSSSRCYATKDPQCSSHPLNSINVIKTCSKETNHSQKDQLQTVIKIRTQQLEEPEQTLEDKFKDLHLNLPVLKVLAHALMYNAILDKYVERLELGKNRSAFIQGKMPMKMKDPGLFTLPCRLGDSKPFDTLVYLGSCVNLILLFLFKKLKIRLLEEIDHVFGLADRTKSYPVGIIKNVEVHIERLKLLDNFYIIYMEKDPATPLLVGRGFLATANAVIDCKREYYEPWPSTGGAGVQPPFYVKKNFVKHHLPWEWQLARDTMLNPFKDVLVFRNMVEFLGVIPINLKGNKWESEELIKKKIDWNKPPKEGDGTDKAKITRKQVKIGQTRTRERKSTQKAGRKLSKSNPGQP